MFQRKPLVFLIILATLAPPVYADKAKDAFNEGVKAERKQDYDTAAANYKQANELSPGNTKYLLAFTRTRFAASNKHVHSGEMMLRTGALVQALAEFQKAAEIDPTSQAALQEAEHTRELIREKERREAATKAEAPPKPTLDDEVAQQVELKPLSNAAISLKMNANADVIYQSVCKLAGLNVIFDPDYKAQKLSVDLTNVTVREALDLLRIQSKTFWRPVLSNTIVVASDTQNKRKELEQNVMRTFYLKNVATPADLQEVAAALKQMLDVAHVQPVPGQDALMLRATPDQMLLAEKLIGDIDKPKSEVIIDITVMEISKDRLRNIGTNVPTSVSVGVTPPGGGGAASTAAAAAASAFKVGSFSFSVPGASFTLLASDSNSKILQSPQVRALNDEKATLRIGDRIPIATGSFSPTAGGASAIVSTQFTYLDVGVNIDITPHIHANGEVTLKMALEISSVTGSSTIGGITQPTIGQRRIEHEARLTDGEVNLLGGILEDTETKSLSGYPIIDKIPLLKYLFGQENKDRQEDEIVFAITPHIVRGRLVTEENRRTVEIGTGNSIELRRKQQPVSPETGAPVGPAKLRPTPANPQAAPPQPHVPAARTPSNTPAVPARSTVSQMVEPPPTSPDGSMLVFASWNNSNVANAEPVPKESPASTPDVSVVSVPVPAATQARAAAEKPVAAKPASPPPPPIRMVLGGVVTLVRDPRLDAGKQNNVAVSASPATTATPSVHGSSPKNSTSASGDAH